MAKKKRYEDEYDGWSSIDPTIESTPPNDDWISMDPDIESRLPYMDPPGPAAAAPQTAPGGVPSAPGRYEYEVRRPTYEPRRAGQIDALVDQILNRKPFQYDPAKDPLYQNYEKQYTRAGQRAMDDTLGKVAARTGGLASSYATTAAQQAYNDQMTRLTDKIPALQQLAYNMHAAEAQRKYDDLRMLQGLEQDDYGRFRGELDQFNRDRGFAYDAAVRKDQTDYDRGRDKIMDQRYADERDRKQMEDRADMMASAGDFSGFLDLGYTPEQVAILKKAYDKAEAERQADRAAARAKKSSGSSRKSGGGDEEFRVDDVDWSAVDQYVEDGGKADEYIGAHYKELGFGSVSQAKDAYKVYKQQAKARKGKIRPQLMLAIGSNLQVGNLDGVQKIVDLNWDSMSEQEREEVNRMYAQFS